MEECHETLVRLIQLDSVLDDLKGRDETPEMPRMTQHESANVKSDKDDWNVALEAEKTSVRAVIKGIQKGPEMEHIEPDEDLVLRLSHANVQRRESVEKWRQRNVHSTGLRTYYDPYLDRDGHSSGSRDTSVLVKSKPTFIPTYLGRQL